MLHERAEPLLSKRGQHYLQKLHRDVAETARAVDRTLSAFLAAVQACDAATQKEYFRAYCDEVTAHQRALRQVILFIDHRLQTNIAEPETSKQALAQALAMDR